MFWLFGISVVVGAFLTGLLNNVTGTPANIAFAPFTDPVGFLSAGIQTAVSALINILPDGGTLPAIAHTAAVYFGATISRWDFVFPVHDLISILLLAVTIKLILFSFHIVRVIFNFVRGIPTWNPF